MKKTLLISFILITFLVSSAWAIGPAPHRLYETQPDGTTLLKTQTVGQWFRDPDQPRYGYQPQSDGIEKILVIRVDFPDQPGQKDVGVFESAFFGDTVSLKRYYQDLTRAMPNPMTVTPGPETMILPTDGGWVRMPQNMAYYGQRDPSGNYPDYLSHLIEMTRDAMTAIMNTVDLSEYDRNGDNEIDHLFIVHAGNDEAETLVTNDLWSLRFSSNVGVFNNMAVRSAIIVPENPSSDRLPIGTFCHEFFHGFGAPDLYDYQLDGIGGVEPVGSWGLMGTGSFLGDGQYPAAICGYLQSDFDGDPTNGRDGFLTPTVLTTSQATVSVRQLGESLTESVYRINIPGTDDQEYFIIENRHRSNDYMCDQELLDDGLLIWHIDEDMRATGYPYPVGFNDGPGLTDYFRVWLEDMSNPNHAGTYLLPNATFNLDDDRTIFTVNSTPSTAANGANEGDFSIYNISHSGPTMTFTLDMNPGPAPDETFAQKNYPNPFTSFTQIDYGLDQPQKCSFRVYNIIGQRVFSENLGVKPAGYHTAYWSGLDDDGQRVVMGQYFFELQLGPIAKHGRMVWVPAK